MLVLVGGVLLVLAIVGPALMLVNVAIDLPRAKQRFSAKHVEAKPLIDSVYAYYQQHGRWPSRDQVGDLNGLLASGWEYSREPADMPPRLILHGPYHMLLSYEFAPNAAKAATRTWTISIEGNRTTFVAPSAAQLE